jgi:hypothetical protein
MSDLRERIAVGLRHEFPLMTNAKSKAVADYVLAFPELRALAAEELFVMCGECHGVRTVPDTVQPHWGRRPCPRCAGVGYVSIGGKQP